MNAIIPKSPINIRAATVADIQFIDSLQRMHSNMVGWMPTKQLEGKIGMGQVIVAEEKIEDRGSRIEDSGGASLPSSINHPPSSPLGYAIGHDQYFKRDDVGIIYQMNVAAGAQRGLIGASLLKAMFERAAYGCRLFCCWCAQDIAANRFWEAMGFVPLAYRAGSSGKRRVHIFWQRRIRAGDVSTPYWFPAQTTGGSIREDRLVLPIGPGKHWSDVMPVVLPQEQLPVASCQLPGKKMEPKLRQPTRRNVQFGPPPKTPEPVAPVKKEKPKKAKVKNDPRLIAAARELRDRWLERVNGGAYLPDAQGKYDVCGALPASVVVDLPALPVAA